MPRDVGDFIGEQNRYERMLAEAMDWDFVEEQTKGSSYDYITPDGTKIEAKFDWDSIKTGNHYLEFASSVLKPMNSNIEVFSNSKFQVA